MKQHTNHPQQSCETSMSRKCPADLLALLGEAAQSVHDLLGLGSVYKAHAEGRNAHKPHRICQDLHRRTKAIKIIPQLKSVSTQRLVCTSCSMRPCPLLSCRLDSSLSSVWVTWTCWSVCPLLQRAASTRATPSTQPVLREKTTVGPLI